MFSCMDTTVPHFQSFVATAHHTQTLVIETVSLNYLYSTGRRKKLRIETPDVTDIIQDILDIHYPSIHPEERKKKQKEK